MRPMPRGLGIRKWVGCIRWRVRKAESGYGRKIWAGSGQMKNFTHFYIKTLRLAGFIFMGQVKIDYCSTITGKSVGYRLNKGENDQ